MLRLPSRRAWYRLVANKYFIKIMAPQSLICMKKVELYVWTTPWSLYKSWRKVFPLLRQIQKHLKLLVNNTYSAQFTIFMVIFYIQQCLLVIADNVNGFNKKQTTLEVKTRRMPGPNYARIKWTRAYLTVQDKFHKGYQAWAKVVV